MDEKLEPEVVVPTDLNASLVALKRKIDAMQVVYLVLFLTSLALIVFSYGRASSGSNMLWAFALGSAVIVRLVRQSMVAKYNVMVTGGRPGPIS